MDFTDYPGLLATRRPRIITQMCVPFAGITYLPLHERETSEEARTHEVAVVAIENLTGPASNEVNNQEQDSQQTVQSASNVVEDNETVQQDNDPLAEENNSKIPAFEDLITPFPGPKIYYNDTTAWVVINEIDQLTIHVASVEEAVALGLAVYYIKDLSYPSCFSQLLGLIESLCLGNNNQFLGKRAKEILSMCVS